jgi:branched-chain amino acid transport system substrate-binding protein
VSDDALAGDPTFLKEVVDQVGGNAANAIYATNPVPDLSSFKTGAAAQFIHDYSAWYPGQALNPYCADAYDAAMVLITAIKHLIEAGQAVTRAAMIEQVQHIQYAGVTGPISFDTNGDIAHGVFSIYEVQGGEWTYLQQVSA